MPSIRDDSTVEAIARAFTSNGRKQEQAMIDVGYTPAYAKSYCGKMWDNPRIIAAIRFIDAKLAQEQGWSVERSQKMLLHAHDVAETHKQPSAMVSALISVNRLHGMDKDNDIGKGEEPSQLTQDEMNALRAMSRELTDKGLRAASGPTQGDVAC